MSREVTVVTPENIPLTLELAGLGARFGALLIDSIAQGVLILTVMLLLWIGVLATGTIDLLSQGSGGALFPWLLAGGILLAFLILFGYFILFETLWNGQTPGKKVLGLRVVRDGGYPINVFAAVARNLVRIADFLPGNYGIGALVVFCQPHYKRLGDLVAGTLVVKERPASAVSVDDIVARGAAAGTLPPEVRNPADVLSADELSLLRRFVIRRGEMLPDDAERLAYRLIVPLVPRLNLSFTPGVPPRYADLVSALVAAADAR